MQSDALKMHQLQSSHASSDGGSHGDRDGSTHSVESSSHRGSRQSLLQEAKPHMDGLDDADDGTTVKKPRAVKWEISWSPKDEGGRCVPLRPCLAVRVGASWLITCVLSSCSVLPVTKRRSSHPLALGNGGSVTSRSHHRNPPRPLGADHPRRPRHATRLLASALPSLVAGLPRPATGRRLLCALHAGAASVPVPVVRLRVMPGLAVAEAVPRGPSPRCAIHVDAAALATVAACELPRAGCGLPRSWRARRARRVACQSRTSKRPWMTPGLVPARPRRATTNAGGRLRCLTPPFYGLSSRNPRCPIRR